MKVVLDAVHYADLSSGDLFYDAHGNCFYRMEERDKEDERDGVYNLYDVTNNTFQIVFSDPGYPVYKISVERGGC